MGSRTSTTPSPPVLISGMPPPSPINNDDAHRPTSADDPGFLVRLRTQRYLAAATRPYRPRRARRSSTTRRLKVSDDGERFAPSSFGRRFAVRLLAARVAFDRRLPPPLPPLQSVVTAGEQSGETLARAAHEMRRTTTRTRLASSARAGAGARVGGGRRRRRRAATAAALAYAHERALGRRLDQDGRRRFFCCPCARDRALSSSSRRQPAALRTRARLRGLSLLSIRALSHPLLTQPPPPPLLLLLLPASGHLRAAARASFSLHFNARARARTLPRSRPPIKLTRRRSAPPPRKLLAQRPHSRL